MRILVYGAGVIGCELAHIMSSGKDKIISMHPLKINLRIGGLTDAPSDQSKRGLKKIFSDTCCSPEWESNMMGWDGF